VFGEIADVMERVAGERDVAEERRATAASEHGRLVLERNRQDEVNLALKNALEKAVKAPVVCWVCRQEMERREDTFVCVSCDAEYRKVLKERDTLSADLRTLRGSLRAERETTREALR
jgi:hypothetical protein